MTYQVGDVVIFQPKNGESCYSPVFRPFIRWPLPGHDPYHCDAKPGDRMRIVKIDHVAGQQRLWYESPYAVYGPAPEYETPGPGEKACHNVLASNVRLSWISRLSRR